MEIGDHTVEPSSRSRAEGTRVFVGLKVAPEIARELAQLAHCLEHRAVRPVAAADIHLTLVPPWKEASISGAIEKLRLVASRFGAFSLTFRHVGYGAQPKRPRLLWAECAATEELAALRAALLDIYQQPDERLFRPHATLSRIRGNGSAIARKHPIEQELSLVQCVETIELFQSPPPGGSGYQVLASIALRTNSNLAPPPAVAPTPSSGGA
jgi:2'-5' RNA ligase